jgi:hypothetical protein
MPRHAHYTERPPETDDGDRTAEADTRDVDIENPFDDPEVRQRMADLIARAARKAKNTRR